MAASGEAPLWEYFGYTSKDAASSPEPAPFPRFGVAAPEPRFSEPEACVSQPEIPAFRLHDLVVDSFPGGRLGLRLQKESLRVTCINEPDARKEWFVGDRIVAVQQKNVTSYEECVSLADDADKRSSAPLVFTVERDVAETKSLATKATTGMIGGVAGGALFGLAGFALVGGGSIAAAAISIPVYFGAFGGSVVGAGRETNESALFSGVIAGFAGPTVTAAFLGGEYAVKAVAESSEVDV